MTRIFDGLAGMASSIMGAPVRFLPVGRDAIDTITIFRRSPVEVLGDDGRAILLDTPWWRVNKAELDPMPKTGDRIEPGDGHIYEITSRHSSGSPARDAFVIYALERVL
ncbi:hypothetical protein M3484_20825 [Pseudomonas sp. GX19020]|uniref:head-tail joining protein n=1 Tax=Pseudomonas sp. GX19020 TaxID=2942277 RepID=UPI00201848F9|nr:hypothetical protein [Pseudomonas sp. GX19020]MCL4069005.1 hypothetical protein [Pseudomonas sp. GX19020]